jgi:hypothetical protein
MGCLLLFNLLVLAEGCTSEIETRQTAASEYENNIDELKENSVTLNSWIIDTTRSLTL